MSEHIFQNIRFYTDGKLRDEDISCREPAIQTGFPKLDAALDGGLTEGLIVLGAGPGEGKSTFALQMAEFIAVRGRPVLYFSFEMSGERIASKMISRRMFKSAKEDKGNFREFKIGKEAAERYVTANDLFRRDSAGKVLTDHRDSFYEARAYVQSVENLYIIYEELSAIQIQKRVAEYMEQNKVLEEGKPLPLVIVDYLQIIPADSEGKSTRSDKQLVEYNLQVMKEIQKQWRIPVLLISSLRRGNYSGEVTPVKMDSFKETGGIEYSADLLMGIQYTACEKMKEKKTKEKTDGKRAKSKPVIYAEDEKAKFPREVSIHILKQRYGEGEALVPFRYYAQFDYFEDLSAPGEVPEEYYTGEVPEVQDVEKAIATKSYSKDQIFFNNTKIVNELRKGRVQLGKPVKSTVSRREEKGIYILYRFSCGDCDKCAKLDEDQRDERDLTQLPCKTCQRAEKPELTCFDWDVADAIYTLYLSRHKQFTVGQILRILSGDSDQTATAKKQEAIEESIEKLRGIFVTIDCTFQMRERHKIAYPEEWFISGPLLSVQVKDEKKVKSYLFTKANPMPLYEYCAEVNQGIFVPRQLLSVSVFSGGGEESKLADTLENISLKRYLIRRLEIIRNEKNNFNSRDILFQRKPGGRDPGLLAEIGLSREQYKSDTAWRNKRNSVYRTTEKILRYYQKLGYIQGCELVDQDTIRITGKMKDPNKLF